MAHEFDGPRATPAPDPTRATARNVLAHVRRLAAEIPDAALREEIVAGCDRFARSGGADRLGPSLTPREIDILALAAVGCGNEEIAALLGNVRTPVKSHLRNAMRKLGVHSRHAAVSAARSRGLLP